MLTRRQTLAIAAALTVGMAMLFVWQREPSHQGRSLSQWLKTLEGQRYAPPETAEALRAMGPDAFPSLLRELHQTTSTFWPRVNTLLRNVGMRFRFSTTPGPEVPAIRAFVLLGSEARPALPKLTEMLDSRYAFNAVRAMATLGPDAIPALTQGLTNADWRVRYVAAANLGLLESAARPALPGLRPLLKDPSSEVRYIAVRTLGDLGGGDSSIVAPLIACLGDGDARVRQEAVRTLGRWRGLTADTIPALAKLLPDQVVGPSVAAALGNLGAPAVPVLMQALTNAPPATAQAIIGALGRIGPDAAEAAPLLLDRLKNVQSSQAAPVYLALASMGVNSEDFAQQLARDLGSSNYALRAMASRSLQQLGTRAAAAAPAVALKLWHPDTRVQTEARRILRIIDPGGEALLAALPAKLTNGTAVERSRGALALTDFQVDAAKAVPPLFDLLMERHDASTPGAVARAILAIDPSGRAMAAELERRFADASPRQRAQLVGISGYLPAAASESFLLRAIKDPAPEARSSAASYLGSRKKGLPQLIEALDDSSATVRSLAIQALARFGADAKEAVPRLASIAKSGGVHGALAARALGEIGPDAAAKAALLELRDGSDLRLRMAAAGALAKVDSPELAPSLARLREGLRGSERDTQLEAVMAINTLGLPAREASSDVLALLKSSDALVRRWAALTLGTLMAKEAIPALEEVAQNDSSAEVRRVARLAVKKIAGAK
ncbi:MAG: HEAT repeat domain-containing protein [Verrucomicrobiota bacterium]